MRPQLSSETEVSIALLCLTCYTAVRIKNSSKSMSVIKVITARNTIVPCAPQLSSETEVSIALLCQLCLTCYTAVRIKKCLKSTSVLKVATMKNVDDFSLRKGSHHVQPPNQRFSLSAKMNGTQRRTLVSPWRMHCTHCGMPKGTSRAEATLNSEKIKPVAIAVIKLCLTEGISQAVRQSVSHKKIPWQLFESISGRSESLFGLVLPNQYYSSVKNWGWFSGDFTSWATPTSWSSLLWTTIVVHD